MSDTDGVGAPEQGGDVTTPPPRLPISPARKLIRASFLFAALAGCGWLIWRTREDFLAALSEVSAGSLILAFLAVFVGGVVPMFAWRVLLADQGSRVPLGASARIYFVSQLGKYIPGSIWSVLAQVELSKEYAVPVRRSGTVALLNLFTAAVSAVVLVAVTLPFSTAGLREDYWWVVLLLPPLLILIHPAVIRRWSSLLFRLLRRDPEPVQLSMPALVWSITWMVIAWILYGLQMYVLVVDAAPADAPVGLALLLQCIGVFALAWVAGLLFIIVPAGAGVREVIIVLGLAPVLPPGAALAVALLSRIMLTVADLMLAGLAAARYRLRSTDLPA